VDSERKGNAQSHTHTLYI